MAMSHVIVAKVYTTPIYVARHTNGFEELAALVKQWTPERAAALTGIPAEDIETLAREYASDEPAVIRLNYGIRAVNAAGGRSRGAGSHGNHRVVEIRRGGMQLSTSQAFQFDRPSLERPHLQKISALGREARIVEYVGTGKR